MGNTASMMGYSVPDLAANAQDIGMAVQQHQWAEGAADQAQRTANEFSERMADTTYQRAVVDMRAAGLNPLLAYQQGGNPAPMGSSVMASVPNLTSGMGQSHVNIGDVSQMAQLKQTLAQTSQSKSVADLNRAQAVGILAAVPNYASTEALQRAQAALTALQTEDERRELQANPQWMYNIKSFLGLSPAHAGGEAFGAAIGGAAGAGAGGAVGLPPLP